MESLILLSNALQKQPKTIPFSIVSVYCVKQKGSDRNHTSAQTFCEIILIKTLFQDLLMIVWFSLYLRNVFFGSHFLVFLLPAEQLECRIETKGAFTSILKSVCAVWKVVERTEKERTSVHQLTGMTQNLEEKLYQYQKSLGLHSQSADENSYLLKLLFIHQSSTDVFSNLRK